MKKALFFLCLIVSLKNFSAVMHAPGLLHNIKDLDLDIKRQKMLREYLFIDGISTFYEHELDESEKIMLLSFLSLNLHTKIHIKISCLRRAIFSSDDYEGNKRILNFLVNHCNNQDELLVSSIAALKGYARTVDLDDPANKLDHILSPEIIEEFGKGEYATCFNYFKQVALTSN